MSKSTDLLSIGAAIIIAACVISFIVGIASKGLNTFRASSDELTEITTNSESLTDMFRDTTVSGKQIKLSCSQFGDVYKFYVRTAWMQKENISAYLYGGYDDLVTKELYRDPTQRFYFNEDATYASSLIYEDGVVTGFSFKQLAE